MLLIEWMIKNNKMTKEVAEDIGVTINTVYCALRGRSIRPSLAVKIEEYTEGQVTRTEALWPEIFKCEISGSIPKGIRMPTVLRTNFVGKHGG